MPTAVHCGLNEERDNFCASKYKERAAIGGTIVVAVSGTAWAANMVGASFWRALPGSAAGALVAVGVGLLAADTLGLAALMLSPPIHAAITTFVATRQW